MTADPGWGTKDKIFSGEYRQDMWDEIRGIRSKQDLRRAFYKVCCRIQELERKIDKIAEKRRKE